MSGDYPDLGSVILAPFYTVGNTWRSLFLRLHVGLKNVGNRIAREVGTIPDVVNRAGNSASGVEAKQMHRDRVYCLICSDVWLMWAALGRGFLRFCFT